MSLLPALQLTRRFLCKRFAFTAPPAAFTEPTTTTRPPAPLFCSELKKKAEESAGTTTRPRRRAKLGSPRQSWRAGTYGGESCLEEQEPSPPSFVAVVTTSPFTR